MVVQITWSGSQSWSPFPHPTLSIMKRGSYKGFVTSPRRNPWRQSLVYFCLRVLNGTVTAHVVGKVGHIKHNMFTALISIGFGSLDAFAACVSVGPGCKLAGELARIGDFDVPAGIRNYAGRKSVSSKVERNSTRSQTSTI
jgi:hypothetical protein